LTPSCKARITRSRVSRVARPLSVPSAALGTPYIGSISTDPDPRDVEFLDDQINRYNIAVTGIDDWRALAIFVRDEVGAIVAGISGGTWAGYLEIKSLWVREDRRGQGHGRRLLLAAEREALARGCDRVLLDTHDFQAIEFYKRLDYTVFGEFDGIGGRYTRYYLRKRLG
jgi:ribosomal protein S18 acetylase RimI-like enzyme